MDFKPLSRGDIPWVRRMLRSHPFRTCDFTVGGIFMWRGYYKYEAAVEADTLFVKGVAVDDVARSVFLLPVGALPIDESIARLREYCAGEGVDTVLSSVPEEALSVLIDAGACSIEPQEDWSDYVYDASALSTFSGKKLAKKRNHLNRFAADNPNAVFKRVDGEDLADIRTFYEELPLAGGKSAVAAYDREQTFDVIDHAEEYGFEGGVLRVPNRGVVAFTFGEVVGDTLHVHVEKMAHDVVGSGETICHRYVAMMKSRYPEIAYVNRQDDSGDMGLRRAKLALHPQFLLHKYNVQF